MSRIAPATVSPIEFEGLRYAQIINGSREGLDQRTGFLSITDIATGRRIAVVKVYPVTFDPRLEADVQDVFFRRMTLDEADRRLMVENERSVRVHVAIDGHAVTPTP